MDELYRQAMVEHLSRLAEELDQLYHEYASGEPLPRLHTRAAERSLQLLIEACIGICKQTLKSKGLIVPSDAREAFVRLAELGHSEASLDWRRIIGLRNVIVHDYLNIDPEIVADVFRSRRYLQLLSFAKELLKLAS